MRTGAKKYDLCSFLVKNHYVPGNDNMDKSQTINTSLKKRKTTPESCWENPEKSTGVFDRPAE